MSRDEYLQKANEGFIKDTLKKGWEKLKSLFSIGMKKVKGFITIFDSNGNVFPVVSPCAVIDKFSGSDAVEVYAPKALSDLTIQAGGNGCEEIAHVEHSDEYFEDAPEGSREYENFLSIRQHFGRGVSESWEGVVRDRNKYTEDSEGLSQGWLKLNNADFEAIVKKLIDQRVNGEGKVVKTSNGSTIKPYDNILVFGAPGIGKSTIPEMIVNEYNKNVKDGDPSKMISLIKINCGRLKSGDLLMPTPPRAVDIITGIQDDEKTFPTAAKYIDSLSPEENERLKRKLGGINQFKVTDVPKSWFPAYRPVGGEYDEIQRDMANSGVYTDDDGKTIKVGNGGIIFLDELLRAEPDIFHELMNFLFERELEGWKLGSKWAIIACSNRPCDSKKVADTWNDWMDEPAEAERFAIKCLLIPDPESWMNYERKSWKEEDFGKIDILFDFIFEKSSRIKLGDDREEYPRWISQVSKTNLGVDSNQSGLSLSPRMWDKIINRIKDKMTEEGINNILKMTEKQLRSACEGSMDPNLLPVFLDWFEQHKNRVDINLIMDDPTFIKLKDEDINDSVRANTVIDSVITGIKDEFGDNKDALTDEKLANIAAWIGINFHGDIEYAIKFVRFIGDEFFDGLYGTTKFIETMYTINAAYPQSDLYDDIDRYENRAKDPWPEDSLERIKEKMRKFFPWRIKGDEILFYGKAKAPKRKEVE